MICTHCGKEIPNDLWTCPYCDKPVRDALSRCGPSETELLEKTIPYNGRLTSVEKHKKLQEMQELELLLDDILIRI